MSSPDRSALLGLASLSLCLLAPPGAGAQQAEQPPLYTFVAQWTVPRAQASRRASAPAGRNDRCATARGELE